MTEVIVTLKAPPLGTLSRQLTSATRPTYAREIAAAQAVTKRNIEKAIPSARVYWTYSIVADGFALVVPKDTVSLLPHIAGVAKVWPNLTYTSLATTQATRAEVAQGPQVIGATKLWGANLADAGAGMKIGIIDDGVETNHPYFSSTDYTFPKGFPKGQVKYATSKVIVERSFPPANTTYKDASLPFDPSVPNGSFHATHVAGIAAGDHDTADGSLELSGVAPKAYLGNYKALTIPTPDFGLDGNSAEIAAAIEQAVKDGMNVINLSLGEPEVEPSRDIVVQALDAAAKAGVVPVIAAGNDYSQFGDGSISSPANAPDAITVAATTLSGEIAGFSSGGPTPVSLLLKPDVSAPGVDITSSLPNDQGGPFGELAGTSMATPQVSGGAVLLKQRHPSWTVEEIKSALVQTADPVKDANGNEVSVLREGGGLINLARADDPLLFADPSSVTFPENGGASTVALTDAGGGSGTWAAAVQVQDPTAGVTISAPSSVSVPGPLDLTAVVTSTASTADVTGFVVLTKAGASRRIPFWVEVDNPVLGTEKATPLPGQGTYSGTTVGGQSLISTYRYPTGGDTTYPGPEVVYSVTLDAPVANFGVAVTSGKAVPHVVYAGDENHLTGYAGLPTTLNPYFTSFGETRPIAGAVLPVAGTYDIVFDTKSAAQAGPFTFRYWVNDTTPPKIRVLSARNNAIVLSVTDAGSGVDPQSLDADIDGKPVSAHFVDGRVTIHASTGKHLLTLSASDRQETKNMEDVAKIKPNTATIRRTITVR